MKVREMRKLIQLRGVTLDPTARRLGACYDVSDLRLAAKRRIPRPVFDYVDGAADEEISVAANTAAFRSWRFLPRVLAGVASASTAASVLDASLPVPLLLGPAGYTRMMHPGRPLGAAARVAVHVVHDGVDRDRGAARGGSPGLVRRRPVVSAVPD
jgi:L-lactate dehydrogenase (cytochrome)